MLHSQLLMHENQFQHETKNKNEHTERKPIIIHNCSCHRHDALTQSTHSIGTTINKSHSKYVVVYNMLTGIRICVCKNETFPLGNMTEKYFNESTRYSFNIDTCKTTANPQASTKNIFKFKDYAPQVFRTLRKKWGISPSDYLSSLTGKYEMNELDSPGKSGCFFYYSQDYKYIIKTIRTAEKNFLIKILSEYYNYTMIMQNTLLIRFFGLHRIQVSGNKKRHFVVMLNIFSPEKPLREVYDIKGCTFGRKVELKEMNNFTVMKDQNWLDSGKKIIVSPHIKEKFLLQLENDVNFLVKMNAMDYSLLLGIVDSSSDRIQNLLLSSQTLQSMGNSSSSSYDVNDKSSVSFLSFPTKLREISGDTKSIENYFGIIDILTPYNTCKKLEHFFRPLKTGHRKEISSVSPSDYGKRFIKFIKEHIFL